MRRKDITTKNSWAKVFQVKLKGQEYCQAKLVGIWYDKFENVPKDILTEDTGLSLEKAITLFSRFKCVGNNVIILTFQRSET